MKPIHDLKCPCDECLGLTNHDKLQEVIDRINQVSDGAFEVEYRTENREE